MIAKERGRKSTWLGLVPGTILGLAVGMAVAPAGAQQDGQQQPQYTRNQRGAAAQAQPKHLDEINVPPLTPKMIPVNPSDPIAIVNDQVITRRQLADECVARKGKEILDLLINRTLIDQALRAKKMDITAADIDQEIDSVARRFQITREQWLRTLDKERGISPVQYARDIIYPTIALRRLCTGRVQVTPDDLKKAFESQFGDKLRCRMILVDKERTALEIWEKLRENPGGFEKMAQERSMDPGTRGLGGLMSEPITRHAIPENLSDAAFRQLVDGDPKDKDPTHKPKDGDFTGPIQVGELGWILLRRESVVPADKKADFENPGIRKQVYDLIYDVKVKEAMGLIYQELLRAAAIENRLTGNVKLANEEKDPNYNEARDEDVKLMSGDPATRPGAARQNAAAAAAAGAATRTKVPPPAALSSEAAQEFEKLQRPLKPGTGNANTTSPATPDN